MLDVAYIFPGQGAQYVGMGEDIYRRYPQAREILDTANRVLGLDLTNLMFKGPFEELTQTANCQVAVFAVSIACLRALEAGNLAITAKYSAGLSLGEYTALVAAGVFGFEQGLKLVRARGQYMEEACEESPGGMVSLIGLPLEAAEKICEQAKAEIANLNCPGQIVISGKLTALDRVREKALTLGAKKVIPLKVGGGFHSSLMACASQKLAKRLEEVEIRLPKLAVVSNVTASKESSSQEIKDNLSRQVVTRTRWEDSIRFIASSGIKTFLEIGPGKVLRGLLRKIDPSLKVYNIGTVEDLESFREEQRQ
ncbi:MAG: ACP S-malonyltransferase [Candidatus Omnitrophica bacterium]|nr:ACP S-malonyltransferase [Candidatus Omnitrophota bacterium]